MQCAAELSSVSFRVVEIYMEFDMDSWACLVSATGNKKDSVIKPLINMNLTASIPKLVREQELALGILLVYIVKASPT